MVRLMKLSSYEQYIQVKNELLEYMEIVETTVNEKKEK